jgi:hypothetical protein
VRESVARRFAEPLVPRRPNYDFERRRKEQERKTKKEEKQARKQAEKEAGLDPDAWITGGGPPPRFDELFGAPDAPDAPPAGGEVPPAEPPAA